jgi:small subunit ribosomal protein S4
MSKYRGPRVRIIRRLGALPTFSQAIVKRSSRPGQHGARKRKFTQFAYRLAEKQKLRFYYGVSEKQLIRYVKAARRAKGSTGRVLLQNLEIRLDNILYRLGWAPTLPAARQLVSHGHILVDQKRVTTSSFSCSLRQVITVQKSLKVRKLVEESLQKCVRTLPSHLSLNVDSLTAVVNKQVDRLEILLNLSELLVIEYYSNRLLIDRFVEIKY